MDSLHDKTPRSLRVKQGSLMTTVIPITTLVINRITTAQRWGDNLKALYYKTQLNRMLGRTEWLHKAYVLSLRYTAEYPGPWFKDSMYVQFATVRASNGRLVAFGLQPKDAVALIKLAAEY